MIGEIKFAPDGSVHYGRPEHPSTARGINAEEIGFRGQLKLRFEFAFRA